MAFPEPFLRKIAANLYTRLALDRSLGVEFTTLPIPKILSILSSCQEDKHPPQKEVPFSTPSTWSEPREKGSTPAARLSIASTPSPSSMLELGGPRELVASPPPKEIKPSENRCPVRGSSEKMAAIEPWLCKALACTQCGLFETRKHVVFGEGDMDTDLVFVGEAPGREEDEKGRPFIGRAGRVLTDIIEKGLKRPRDSVYICNILKCRPPGNREPRKDEMEACSPYLERQIEVIRPKVLVAVGRIAAIALTGRQLPMGEMRGQWYEYRGIPLMVIYHPSYLLRRRSEEGGDHVRTDADRQTWQDIRKVAHRLQLG